MGCKSNNNLKRNNSNCKLIFNQRRESRPKSQNNGIINNTLINKTSD